MVVLPSAMQAGCIDNELGHDYVAGMNILNWMPSQGLNHEQRGFSLFLHSLSCITD